MEPAELKMPDAEFARALAAHQQGDLDTAQRLYREILGTHPTHFDALHLLGVIALQRGQLADALALIRQAIALQPASAPAHDHLGLCLQDLGRLQEALAAYDRALVLDAGLPSALNNRGTLLLVLKRPQDAVRDLEAACRQAPQAPGGWVNLCAAQRALRQFEVALASAERALALDARLPEAWLARGNVLAESNRLADALASYTNALALRPADQKALSAKGQVLRMLKRHGEAADCFAQLLALAPDYPEALGALLFARLNACDWTGHAALTLAVEQGSIQGRQVVSPFALLTMSDSPAAQLRCAQTYAAAVLPVPGESLWKGERYRHPRIRVAYLSADFHEHATAYLMAELFEQHDRTRFEVTGISFGPDDHSPMRQRLLRGFDDFVDVRGLDDAGVARLIREREIDVAVDLKGYTQDSRPAILAWRPAPVQVNYLGYPGSMGVPWIDYIVADRHVIPPGQEGFYAEQVVRLPHCYQVNDAHRPNGAGSLSRTDAGLPAQGFVFCCFNNNFKITPPVFAVWMHLLQQVPGSVLWLLQDNSDAAANLRRATAQAGVDPARLVFAQRAPLAAHLDRHRLADLFLDTWPYGAHTSASDALWCGLPVLTRTGNSFASRVAASLLQAVGLPELVTHSLEGYAALALRLAQDSRQMADIKNRLLAQALRSPLFDGAAFRQSLEQAFVTMHGRASQGLPPKGFDLQA